MTSRCSTYSQDSSNAFINPHLDLCLYETMQSTRRLTHGFATNTNNDESLHHTFLSFIKCLLQSSLWTLGRNAMESCSAS